MVMMAFLIMQDKLMVDPGQDLDQVLANKVLQLLCTKATQWRRLSLAPVAQSELC